MRLAIGDNYIDATTELSPVETVFDDTANDSDKSFVVPDGEMWKINFAYATLATTATVGNRQIVLRVLDENGNSIFDSHAGAVQAASLTLDYGFYQGIFRETTFVATEIQCPIPADLYMKAGYTLRMYDAAAIDAAADDLTVSFQYKRYKGA